GAFPSGKARIAKAPRPPGTRTGRLSCNCPWPTVLSASLQQHPLSIWRPPPDTYACATRSKGRSSLAPFGGQPGGEPKEMGKKEGCYPDINQHVSSGRWAAKQQDHPPPQARQGRCIRKT